MVFKDFYARAEEGGVVASAGGSDHPGVVAGGKNHGCFDSPAGATAEGGEHGLVRNKVRGGDGE